MPISSPISMKKVTGYQNQRIILNLTLTNMGCFKDKEIKPNNEKTISEK